ncbi:DUF2306 domain-containing protein [Brevibacillus sp. H7]|uniref:DUF2306 domain-containing protein n=1 Tax=Brevibacillus sp. H7 TaxID=3349138 RepID=UPI0038232505
MEGIGSGIAFLVLDVCWLVTTGLGVWHIRRRNIPAHREWILRSYAVTWVFVSFRVVVALISITWNIGNEVSFPLAVSISIAGNLLITEAYLRSQRKGSLGTAL